MDKNLTRQEITTFLERAVNLGCYVTKTKTTETVRNQATSPVTYVWLKGNNSISQTNKSRVHGNVLVVTPRDDTDFGTYHCDVTNGVSSTRCRIELKRGWTKAGQFLKLIYSFMIHIYDSHLFIYLKYEF